MNEGCTKLTERRAALIEYINGVCSQAASALPHSADGKDADIIFRYSFAYPDEDIQDGDGEYDGTCTLYYETVISSDGGDEHSFVITLKLDGDEYSQDELMAQTESFKQTLCHFFSQLEGKSHTDCLNELSCERFLHLSGEEERAPFDYKCFFIGASVVCVTLILMLIIVNEILPRLL